MMKSRCVSSFCFLCFPVRMLAKLDITHFLQRLNNVGLHLECMHFSSNLSSSVAFVIVVADFFPAHFIYSKPVHRNFPAHLHRQVDPHVARGRGVAAKVGPVTRPAKSASVVHKYLSNDGHHTRREQQQSYVRSPPPPKLEHRVVHGDSHSGHNESGFGLQRQVLEPRVPGGVTVGIAVGPQTVHDSKCGFPANMRLVAFCGRLVHPNDYVVLVNAGPVVAVKESAAVPYHCTRPPFVPSRHCPGIRRERVRVLQSLQAKADVVLTGDEQILQGDSVAWKLDR
mmetsp:Transcript_4622/g.6215  ORF Transcript_4622/g.6215 Transcript_4622/m.6215 type:complete len:283 (-) Transcript_4622:277-1125(-)